MVPRSHREATKVGAGHGTDLERIDRAPTENQGHDDAANVAFPAPARRQRACAREPGICPVDVDPVMRAWLTQPGVGLAVQLRDIRVDAGLGSRELADKAGWTPSKPSKLENGRQKPTEEDIRTWCRVCKANSKVQPLLNLLAAAKDVSSRSRRRGWRRIDALVDQAKIIRQFDLTVVPPLLQTADYARSLLTRSPAGAEQADVEPLVAARIEHQQAVLYDTDRRLEFLLAEPVLHWRIAAAPVMRGQLDRLAAVSGMSHVRLGIVPLDSELPVPPPSSSFRLYDGAAVVIETVAGEIARGADADRADFPRYAELLDAMWSVALEGPDADRAIYEAAALVDPVDETPPRG